MTVGRTKRGVLGLLAVMPDVLNRASIVGRTTRGLLGSTGVGDRPLATGCRPLMLLVWVLWSVGVGGVGLAQELPDAIRADQYRLAANKALKEQDPRRAIEALEKYAGVATDREWEFLYIYGTLLVEYGATAAEVGQGQAVLVELVKKVGPGAEPYLAALEELNVAEEKLEAFKRAAEADQRAAEAKRAEESRRAEARRVGRRFRDCEACPEMVVVPAGTLMMGSPASEAGRDDDEGPVHRVTIAQPFAVGVYEVTRGEFGRFVGATGYSTGDRCRTFENGEWEARSGRGWRNPGYQQGEREPVVCVSWEDAQAYVRWLSEETGQRYRLLSEAEWEYVARAGTTTARYWGESEAGQCRYANGADQTAKSHNDGWTVAACDDGHYQAAPVGRYEANAFGLHDVLGNVWEWTEDCWNKSYAGAPSNGGAWESGECSSRVVRGGSWIYIPRFLRSAIRLRNAAGNRYNNNGVRLARTLTP